MINLIRSNTLPMLRFSAWIEIWDNFSLSRGDIENQKIWFLEQIANLVFLCQHTLLLTRKRQLATFNIAPITNNLFMPLFRNLHPETSKTKTFEKMTVLVATISATPQSIQCQILNYQNVVCLLESGQLRLLGKTSIKKKRFLSGIARIT